MCFPLCFPFRKGFWLLVDDVKAFESGYFTGVLTGEDVQCGWLTKENKTRSNSSTYNAFPGGSWPQNQGSLFCVWGGGTQGERF